MKITMMSAYKKNLSMLEAYHHKITATRTLFVTHLSEPLFTQSYVSPGGFALLDLFEDRYKYTREGSPRGDIKPIHATHDTIPPGVTPYSRSALADKDTSIEQFMEGYLLATKIYRSYNAWWNVVTGTRRSRGS